MSWPAFHYHHKETGVPIPSRLTVDIPPTFGVKHKQCPECGRWGYLSVQADRNRDGIFRVMGQGHTSGSRVFNGLPVQGILMMRQRYEYFLEEASKLNIAELYIRGEALMRRGTKWDGFAVVPVWRDDYRSIERMYGDTDEMKLKHYAEGIANIYDNVNVADWRYRIDQHLRWLKIGFLSPSATIPRVNLTRNRPWTMINR